MEKSRKKKNDSGKVMERWRLVRTKKAWRKDRETGKIEEFSLAVGDSLSLCVTARIAISHSQFCSKHFHKNVFVIFRNNLLIITVDNLENMSVKI